MRCPPGLVFDDSYQRCEWPINRIQSPRSRMRSLRDKIDQIKNKEQGKSLVKTQKDNHATVSPSEKEHQLAEP